MSENSNLEATIDRDLGRLTSEYYSIVELAREYNAPVLAMVDRQDLKYLKEGLKKLMDRIEYLPDNEHKKKVQQETAVAIESISHSLLRI